MESIVGKVIPALLLAWVLFLCCLAVGQYLKNLTMRFGIRTFWIGLLFDVAYAGTIVFVLCRVVDFSNQQSLVIAGIVGTGIWLHGSNGPPPQFKPFWIRIEPIWYRFLLDHGVVDEDGWKRVRAAGFNNAAHGHISLTVLGPTLFYSHQLHSFFTELTYQLDLDDIWPQEMKEDPFPDAGVERLIGPWVRVKESYDRWEFSLVTPESIRKRKHEYDRESCLIPLAQLPKKVLSGYYGVECSRKEHQKLEKEIEEAGWKRRKRDHDDSYFGIPFELEHKYFIVRYDNI
jgi:hypothetical protein